MTSGLQDRLAGLPKVELHVHLEGSIQPATALELARRNHVTLPFRTPEEARHWVVCRDFPHFLESYLTLQQCLQTVDDYEVIVYEFGATLARQHVRYAEVTFTPAGHEARGVPFAVSFEGLTRGRKRVQEDFGVQLAWVFDIARSLPDRVLRERAADHTVEVAIAGMDDGVVALGLGGLEAGYPPEWFGRWFARARTAGLRSVPHAGETLGPESIWNAIRTLGADRIGHGVRAIEDPALVSFLARERIPLEVCPTSNLCLGIYRSLAAHPLRRLHEAGVVVTINSDDPAFFNSSLNDELCLLHDHFALGIDVIEGMVCQGIRSSFLAPEAKGELERQFWRARANVLRDDPEHGQQTCG